MLSINILPERTTPSAKVCMSCRKYLPIGDFALQSKGKHRGICKDCQSEKYHRDPERKRKKQEYGKLWRDRHPDIRAYMRDAAKLSYHRHYERNKTKQRLEYQRDPEAGRRQRVIANYKIYGITEDDFLRMEKAQGGVCAICRRPERRKVRGRVTRLSVDHCHKTGRVRGLLCAHCNSKLSLVEQLVDHMGIDLLIERLRQYLGV